jgi:formylglycine-generating enzyme required for sulfatase activity
VKDRKQSSPVEPETIRIRKGEFLMGTTAGQAADLARAHPDQWTSDLVQPEMSEHQIDLPTFEIGKYPVANREYRAFVLGTGHPPPVQWEGDTYPEGLGEHPVV